VDAYNVVKFPAVSDAASRFVRYPLIEFIVFVLRIVATLIVFATIVPP
jgi:hypothetical protein